MKIKIKLNYSSNFKIKQTAIKKQFDYITPKRTDKRQNSYSIINPVGFTPRVLCKHAIFILMNFLVSNSGYKINKDILSSCTFSIKPTKSKRFTLLRAPYRYKIARNQIEFKRFYIKFSLILKVISEYNKLILSNSLMDLNTLSSSLNAIYSDLDTNICNQTYVMVHIPFSFTNFFKLNNYK